MQNPSPTHLQMPAPPLFPRPSSASSASSTPQPPPLRPSASTQAKPNRSFLSPRIRRPALLAVVRSKNKDEASFTERILDYIEGGPKLRKWYGAPDLLPKEGDAEDEEDESSGAQAKLFRNFKPSCSHYSYSLVNFGMRIYMEEPRDAVLVTNGDSDIGQMVILSLILKRARVKALVKDRRSTQEAFGNYVECMVGNVEDKFFTKKALRGVRSVICPGDDGFFSDLIDLRDVKHIVLLSQLSVYRNISGLQAIMNSKLRKLAEKDEEVVLASGIPSTIIRTASLQTSPGGESGFDFTEGVAAKGRISKEDAALVCVEALDAIPQTTLIFEVARKACFAERMAKGYT